MFSFIRTCLRGAQSGAELSSQANPWRASLMARLMVLLLLTSIVPQAVRSQVLYGSLTGNVVDQKGAAVPGAKVEAKNLGTGVSKEMNSNETGGFQFSDLQPGLYSVTFTLASFKTLIQENVRIEANTVRRVDAELQVADVKETVVVTQSAVPLQTDRADLNINQTTRQINDLPLTGSLGRNYQSLMALVPGSVGAGEQNSAAGNPQRSISFNVNGVSRLQNNTRIDGAGVVYPWLPTNTVYVPPAESIQTVNIVTNSFDAEQGLAGGAAVNLSIKTGTNSFHGTGWVYHTNNRFAARNPFVAPCFQQPGKSMWESCPNAKSLLTQFGYAIGGPIIKNKLFFFTDFERTTQRNAARVQNNSVAPASLRPDAQGNVNFTSTGITIYDPLSNPNPALRTAFLNDTIPANRIDIAALELMKRLPLPTGSGFVNNFNNPPGSALFNRNNIDTKINYNYSDRLSIFGRYSISPTTIIEPSIFGDAGGPALNGGQQGAAPSRIQVVGVGGTYAFAPNLVLDANIGYTRQRLGAENFDIDSNFGLDVLKIPGTNGPDRLQGGIPSFQISGWTNLGNDNTGNPFLFRDNQYLFAGNLSWLKGSHDYRFGVDYQNQQINHFQPQGGTFQTVRGTFTFDGAATRLQGAAAPSDSRYNSWADFLLGQARTAGKVDQLRNPNSIYMVSYALYARDHWQINRKVTLTYGLRWERYPFPDKDNTGINRFDPATGNVITGGLSGVPRDTGAKSGPGKFLPRVGVAYRYNDKTVIRGGYGQSADPRPFIDFRNAYPVVNAFAMPAISFNGATNAFIPVTTLRQGLIITGAPDLTQGILKLPANSGTTTYPADPERRVIHSFNLLVERELPWKFTVQTGYVGTRAVGQMGFININAGAPGTGTAGRALFSAFGLTQDINEILPYGTTTYDSWQTTLNRRWRGSLFGTVYTWSKAINFADNDANPRIQYMPEKQRNRGLAGYDRTHNFELYGVLDGPFGKGERWLKDGWASKLLGGFQLNPVLSIQSGTPFYVVQGSANNLNAGGSGQVPDQLSEITILDGIGAGNPYFSNKVFSATCGVGCANWMAVNIPAGQAQRFGTAGRNNLRGPGYLNLDLGLFRTLSFSERYKLQLRVEALNALNHPNFSNPGADVSNAGTFGLITSTTGQGSRIYRFAAKFNF